MVFSAADAENFVEVMLTPSEKKIYTSIEKYNISYFEEYQAKNSLKFLEKFTTVEQEEKYVNDILPVYNQNVKILNSSKFYNSDKVPSLCKVIGSPSLYLARKCIKDLTWNPISGIKECDTCTLDEWRNYFKMYIMVFNTYFRLKKLTGIVREDSNIKYKNIFENHCFVMVERINRSDLEDAKYEMMIDSIGNSKIDFTIETDWIDTKYADKIILFHINTKEKAAIIIRKIKDLIFELNKDKTTPGYKFMQLRKRIKVLEEIN